MAAAIIFPIERPIVMSREQGFGKTARTAPERDTRTKLFSVDYSVN
jgi:hypothetical protein